MFFPAGGARNKDNLLGAGFFDQEFFDELIEALQHRTGILQEPRRNHGVVMDLLGHLGSQVGVAVSQFLEARNDRVGWIEFQIWLGVIAS